MRHEKIIKREDGAKEYSKHVTPEEILQAKMELWEKLKPV